MLEKGLQFIKEVVVKPENLAVAMGSGDLPVLGSIHGKCSFVCC